MGADNGEDLVPVVLVTRTEVPLQELGDFLETIRRQTGQIAVQTYIGREHQRASGYLDYVADASSSTGFKPIASEQSIVRFAEQYYEGKTAVARNNTSRLVRALRRAKYSEEATANDARGNFVGFDPDALVEWNDVLWLSRTKVPGLGEGSLKLLGAYCDEIRQPRDIDLKTAVQA